MRKQITLELFGTPGCCLCDELLDHLQPHLKKLGKSHDVELIKRNIADDEAWLETYRYRIPVLTCEGKVLLEGRPTEAEIATAMKGLM
jgi:thiol-disulfide isomerase/thioredoxin